MKKFRLLFLVIMFSFYFTSTVVKEIFKVSTISDDKTEIIFSIPDVEIINNQGQIEFKPDDLIFTLSITELEKLDRTFSSSFDL